MGGRLMRHGTWHSILRNERGGFGKLDLGITSFIILSIVLYWVIPSHEETTATALYVGLSVAGFLISLRGGYTAPLAMLAAGGVGFLVRAKGFGPHLDVILPWGTYLVILISSILLESAADNKENEKKDMAVRKVKEAEEAEDLVDLGKALFKNPAEAKEEALAAIVRIGGKEAIETLMDAGLYKDAIEHFGDDAPERLLGLVESGNVKDMQYAVLTLGELGEEKMLDRVLEYKNDEAGYIRENVAEALGRIGGQRAGGELAGMAADQEWYVRKSVAEALGDLGGQEAINSLAWLVGDSYWQVREAATESYGKIGGPEALKALAGLGSDEEVSVRRKTKAALEGIGTPEAADAAAKVDISEEG